MTRYVIAVIALFNLSVVHSPSSPNLFFVAFR